MNNIAWLTATGYCKLTQKQPLQRLSGQQSWSRHQGWCENIRVWTPTLSFRSSCCNRYTTSFENSQQLQAVLSFMSQNIRVSTQYFTDNSNYRQTFL